jgi:FtsP/CotA-like multicopper oxidase with cupredoxin domain
MPTPLSNRVPHNISRRDFLKIAGGTALAAAGIGMAPQYLRRALQPEQVVSAADPAPDLYFAGTDGWITLPSDPAIPIYHPDPAAPSPFTTYIFGFRNITGLNATQISKQKMHAQHNAPIFWVKQFNPAAPRDFRMQLTNLGLQMRPDLTDSHTLHWHGFRNVIPFFDGEPTGSVSVPVGRNLTYIYRPREPGTYMYHCHVEDVEHVHMGMTGLVFVRPLQDGTPYTYQGSNFTKFAYNDGNGSSGFHREYAMFLSEVWAEAHWADAHIQLPEWSDYRADFSLLNGRVYPDTLAANGSIDPFNPVRDANGDLIAPPGAPHLQYQPLSSLITCEAGESVLLRFANLGFREASMTLAGIKLRVVGRDATLMRGRDGTDTSYETDTITMGAGESFDAIFKAPAKSGPGAYDTYVLYNRRYTQSTNPAGGFGGQRTEIRVYAPGSLGVQQYPNHWGV